eukprot:jgi/Ulvmu1/7270/UM035_0058.1
MPRTSAWLLSPRIRPTYKVARQSVQLSVIQDNPQNVGNPQVLPSKEFSPEESVSAQLDALQENGSPWYNHGIFTMYEFALDVGGLERSRYFGYSKDLYHLDHFAGEFANKFEDIIDHYGYKIVSSEPTVDGFHEVKAEVKSHCDSTVNVMFVMKVKDVGRTKGCWKTACLTQLE